jgi:hypothetical protein
MGWGWPNAGPAPHSCLYYCIPDRADDPVRRSYEPLAQHAVLGRLMLC